MIPQWKIYPRSQGHSTVYLQNVVDDPSISVGDYTIYDDFVHDPRDFQRNNVLYHYPINHERLVIGKFCSIACGAKFLFNSANHTQRSLSTYIFPVLFEEWGLDVERIPEAWDTTSGAAMKRWSWPALPSGTGLSSVPGRWSQKTSRPIPSWAACPPRPSGSGSLIWKSPGCWS